jgi:hypothetical protein
MKLKDRLALIEERLEILEERLRALEPLDQSEDPSSRFDREVLAAVWRRRRAAEGRGYQFKAPTRASS